MKRHRSISLVSLGLATVSLGGRAAWPAQDLRAQNAESGFGLRCTALADRSRGDLVIGEAELVAAGTTAPAGPGGPGAAPPPTLPEHCRIRGTIAPRGADPCRPVGGV